VERKRVIASLVQSPTAPLDLGSGVRRVLSAGSGPENEVELTWNQEWNRQGYEVVRLDIDPRSEPDILASMTDMGEIGSFDVVYCCHALEHLYPHEVGLALKEFLRVLKPGGYAVIMVPDLEDVRPDETLLDYPKAGLITGLHLFYGDYCKIPEFPHMAHHSGFVKKTLYCAMVTAGFINVVTTRAPSYNLIGTGQK
jgi:SAM-dependent methyltransferase